ncbi:ribosomal protein L12E/L44/L45/RPP1/RPP2 [Bacillus sp. SLBN-46]|jgi:ribosomal protein L12E/L44/L45/RPP1/RPP2|nr:ribosomal protein L12E/L44/L45/RPP1/RPP2 [Bacillus sp. SLBN-46]
MRVKIFENIINHKINTITAEELVKYANQFNIKVNQQQARKIAEYLRGKNINIFDDTQRSKLVKEIAKAAGPETAREVNKLLMQITKQ